MLLLQNVAYAHPDKQLLFENINFTLLAGQKTALIGNNGTGKSTLLKLMAGQIQPSSGYITAQTQTYYIPQVFDQFNHLSVADALQAGPKITALRNILDGDVSEKNLTILDDDWNITERCRIALDDWQLQTISTDHPFALLSGGQKMRVFLAGIQLNEPGIVLLDEPTNHLDAAGRNLLYNYIEQSKNSIVVVSHDRTLLNLMPTITELSRGSIKIYGGNYDFYVTQKSIEENAMSQQLESKEKALRKAREAEREIIERQQKLDARGKKKQEKAGLPTIMMNTYRNTAEGSSARVKASHAAKVQSLADNIVELRKQVPDADAMRLLFNQSDLHNNKTLIEAKNINYQYNDKLLWQEPLNLQITSRDRIALKGNNGTGKTTLIRLILGSIEPVTGNISRSSIRAVYIDQEYSLLNDILAVYEQAQHFNESGLQEHELKIRLNRFLFTKNDWDKRCGNLSGGEKMRLLLCCLTITGKAPDMIILDEPTNNLDIQNLDILAGAIAAYEGALLVVSHDEHFLQNINVSEELVL